MASSNFGRDIERMLRDTMRDAVKDATRETQRAFDSLTRLHRGKPVEDVIPHVRRTVRQLDMTASDAEVRDYATAIASGDGIKFVIS